MGAAVIVFWIMIGVLGTVAVLGIIGLIMIRRDRKKNKTVPSEQDGEVLPIKTVENVMDLSDRFNRARYMDQDGK